MNATCFEVRLLSFDQLKLSLIALRVLCMNSCRTCLVERGTNLSRYIEENQTAKAAQNSLKKRNYQQQQTFSPGEMTFWGNVDTNHCPLSTNRVRLQIRNSRYFASSVGGLQSR